MKECLDFLEACNVRFLRILNRYVLCINVFRLNGSDGVESRRYSNQDLIGLLVIYWCINHLHNSNCKTNSSKLLYFVEFRSLKKG